MPILRRAGFYDEFKLRVIELMETGTMKKATAYNQSWTEIQPKLELTAAGKSDEKKRERQSVAAKESYRERKEAKAKAKECAEAKALLDKKPPATKAQNISWVHVQKSILRMGGAVDYRTAPSWEAISYLDDALRDPNWLKKLSPQETTELPEGSEDDGGNPSILTSFLEKRPPRSRKERSVPAEPAPRSDASGGGGEEIAG